MPSHEGLFSGLDVEAKPSLYLSYDLFGSHIQISPGGDFQYLSNIISILRLIFIFILVMLSGSILEYVH